MKKTTLIILCAVFTLTAFAENPAYVNKMKETIEEMNQCQTTEDFKDVANTFDRIATKEQGEWLPLYYKANIHVLLVYIDANATLEQKDLYLDQAEATIEKMEKLAPDEAEIAVLKSFMIVSRIGLDGQARGQSMYPMYEAALAKAKELEPENPRVKYMLLSKEVGQAQWFGQPIDQYCPDMKALYESWDEYKPKSEIHPKWGKEQLAQIMQQCK